jgi:hypothetical protein
LMEAAAVSPTRLFVAITGDRVAGARWWFVRAASNEVLVEHETLEDVRGSGGSAVVRLAASGPWLVQRHAHSL